MIKKSKSIEEIYNEAKNYDMVITSDAPLATALNKLVDKPRLEYLAMTPRQIAFKFAMLHFSKIYSKAEIILEIFKNSKKSLKRIHQSIEKIFEIWNNTGILENCLQFLTNEEKEFIPYLEKFASAELAMERFDEEFYGNKKIAVIGIELFNLLDRQILPRKNIYPDEIKLFSDDENEIKKTYLFNSSNAIVNKVLSLITKENESEIAIVLNTESDYLDQLKSGLNEKGINLQIKKYLSEDNNLRNILSFIEISFRADELKIKDLSVYEGLLKFFTDRKFYNYYINSYLSFNKNKILKEVYDIMKRINSFTYRRFIEILQKDFKAGISEEFIKVLKTLELYEEKISEDNYNLLIYFIMHIDVEVFRDREGVLFVNAMNSAFIDKPVIFFIGMDESWTKTNPDKAFIDKYEEGKKNLDKFQILLSQGELKYHFALNIKNNSKVIPCYYFNILVSRNIKSFENDFFNPVFAEFKPDKNEYNPEKEKLNVPDLQTAQSISPSSLNKFIICPKLFSYYKLMPNEDQAQFMKGTLLHNFAEFYFNHQEFAKENFDRILKYIIEEFTGFVKTGNLELEKSYFTMGMNSIIRFIEVNNFKKYLLKEPIEYKDNFLFRKTNKLKLYFNTEKWMEKNNSGIKGKMDLISENIIVDYKASKVKKNEKQLLNEFKLELLQRNKIPDVNFQTIAYLAGKRDELSDSELRFIYCYLFADRRNIIDESEIEINNTTIIKYFPYTFKEYIISENLFEQIKNEFLIKLGYENYKKIMEENYDNIKFYESKSISNNLEDKFYYYWINNLGLDYKFFKNRSEKRFRDDHIQKFLKIINRIRTGDKNEGIIFKDDIDNFINIVEEKIKELNIYQNSNFPNKPIFDLRDVCGKCDYLNICIGNKLWSADEGIAEEGSENEQE